MDTHREVANHIRSVLANSKEVFSNVVLCYSTVMMDITDERARQESKWGQQNHSFEHYYQVLNEELGEASKAYLDSGYAYNSGDAEGWARERRHFREEMVQAAAVLVAMIECGDRNGWWSR